MLPAEALVLDFDLDSESRALWVIGCDCFDSPPVLRVVRADESGVSEPAQIGAPRFENGALSVDLGPDVVTEGSVWALQTIDLDGRVTSPVCAEVAFRGE